MFKKVLCLIICATLMLALAACTDKKADDPVNNDIENDLQQSETANENKNNSQDNGFTKIEVNVKPLDEFDEELLSQSAEKLGFENKKLFHAFANAIDKTPDEVTREDIDKVHYIAIGPEGEGEYSVFVGHIDYVDLCLSDQTSEPDFSSRLSKLVKMSEFEYDAENDTLSDLGNFKNVEMFEIYDVKIEDVSFIKNYPLLIFGFFRNNGIVDISSLKDYNPDSLAELDFTGNEIDDWSPVEAIKDKITVYFEMTSGVKLTLPDYLEQQENPIDVPSHEESTPENTQQDSENENTDEFVFVDENGSPADFGSLFD